MITLSAMCLSAIQTMLNSVKDFTISKVLCIFVVSIKNQEKHKHNLILKGGISCITMELKWIYIPT